jgi:hypothetical protein
MASPRKSARSLESLPNQSLVQRSEVAWKMRRWLRPVRLS